MSEYSSMEEWLEVTKEIYALEEVEENKFKGTESGITAVRQGPFFGIFFNDGMDLFFFKEGHATMLDFDEEEMEQLRLLLCPWINCFDFVYLPKSPELPDDYYDNPEYSVDPTQEEWDRWHEIMREREREKDE